MERDELQGPPRRGVGHGALQPPPPLGTTPDPFVTEALANAEGPIVAVTDYMKAVPDQVARWVPAPFISLGTDGFGRSRYPRSAPPVFRD